MCRRVVPEGKQFGNIVLGDIVGSSPAQKVDQARTFIEEETNIAFRLGQQEGFLQSSQGLGGVTPGPEYQSL